jgi:signal transduction histidine kinase
LVDVLELASKVAQSLAPRAELQGVTITVEQTQEPVIARADPNQLQQILLNLLLNALDAQPSGGEVQITAKIVPAAPDGQQFILTIQDRGPGLPAQVGDRIFEPFVSTKESGLGLGLSICRRIAEAHGGTLTAANRLDGGAAFTLRIPNERETRIAEPATKNQDNRAGVYGRKTTEPTVTRGNLTQ